MQGFFKEVTREWESSGLLNGPLTAFRILLGRWTGEIASGPLAAYLDNGFFGFGRKGRGKPGFWGTREILRHRLFDSWHKEPSPDQRYRAWFIVTSGCHGYAFERASVEIEQG